MSIYKIYDEFIEFKINWDNYNYEERKILLNQFQKELNQIEIK